MNQPCVTRDADCTTAIAAVKPTQARPRETISVAPISAAELPRNRIAVAENEAKKISIGGQPHVENLSKREPMKIARPS
jgi:hypothetical protein